MGMYLNKTGRPILYSCEWPLYDYQHGHTVITFVFQISLVALIHMKPTYVKLHSLFYSGTLY